MEIQLSHTRITRSDYNLITAPTIDTKGSVSVSANFSAASTADTDKFFVYTNVSVKGNQEKTKRHIFTLEITVESLYENDTTSPRELNTVPSELFFPNIVIIHQHINDLLNKAQVGKVDIGQEMLLGLLNKYITERG